MKSLYRALHKSNGSGITVFSVLVEKETPTYIFLSKNGIGMKRRLHKQDDKNLIHRTAKRALNSYCAALLKKAKQFDSDNSSPECKSWAAKWKNDVAAVRTF